MTIKPMFLPSLLLHEYITHMVNNPKVSNPPIRTPNCRLPPQTDQCSLDVSKKGNCMRNKRHKVSQTTLATRTSPHANDSENRKKQSKLNFDHTRMQIKKYPPMTMQSPMRDSKQTNGIEMRIRYTRYCVPVRLP